VINLLSVNSGYYRSLKAFSVASFDGCSWFLAREHAGFSVGSDVKWRQKSCAKEMRWKDEIRK
jgi:hypothetical protein